MSMIDHRKCRTQYCEQVDENLICPQERRAKGEIAQQNLHQLSVIDNQSQLFDPMSNWLKFNQASLKLVNEEKKQKNMDFDQTLIKLRKNTTLLPKKQLYRPTKKYVRPFELTRKIQNNHKSDLISHNNYASVNLKLNFTGKRNYERIHSHSVKMDSSGKIKIEPKEHFANFEKIIPKTDLKEKSKSILLKARANKSRKSQKVQSVSLLNYDHKKTIPLTENENEKIFPPNLLNLKKFQSILQTLRKNQRQNILTIQTAYQKPTNLRGTIRKTTRFSTS